MAKNEVDTKKENKVKKHFFKDMKAELKRVIWPTRKQLVNNTIAVVTIVLIVVAVVFVLDSIFDVMHQYGVTKLQSYVDERFGEDDEEETQEKNNENKESTEENNSEEGKEESSENNEATTTEEQKTESNEQ